MSDRLKFSPTRDFGFYQRRKHDKWRAVPAPSPTLETAVADSHAHVHMLPDPAWELARCAANGVDYVCMIVDPSEDGTRPYDELAAWEREAQDMLEQASAGADVLSRDVDGAPEGAGAGGAGAARKGRKSGKTADDEAFVPPTTCKSGLSCPTVRIATGVHPHNAERYDEAMERQLVARLSDERVGALGEIGLDYYYDFSPRDVQQRVFRRQIALAKEADLPIALHLRSGEDAVADNAHAEAFAILQEEGFPEQGVLLHCCALPPDELIPWVETGCFIAYGGAVTFKNADAAREGVRMVPQNRLMLETDTPYMTPEPMRGAGCTPAHVVFVAAALAEIRGVPAGEDRRAFLDELHANTQAFYARR